MIKFITDNPAFAMWLISGLGSFIGLLVGCILFFVKRSFDNLTTAIINLDSSIKEDRTDISGLKNRMQKQETTCEMQRSQCPNHSR